MEKKELKEKLKTIVGKIKTNSKDQQFAQKLVDDLLSTKGQLDVEPLELDCGKKEKEYLGDTYRITLTNKGVLYHEYGGYNIFVTPSQGALYECLSDMVINQGENAKMEGEQKDNLSLMQTVLGWVLQTPKYAITDAQLSVEIATMVIKHINDKYEELMSKGLQDETVEEYQAYKDATMALETLKEEVKKEG